jgi:lipopolysaccharide export system permease protein
MAAAKGLLSGAAHAQGAPGAQSAKGAQSAQSAQSAVTPTVRPIPGVDPSSHAVQITSLKLDMDRAERRISECDTEIQKKLALSLACLVFALLGPPIALRFPRSGVGLTIGVSLVAFAIYYIGLIAGESLADNLKVSPLVAMWAANALLGGLGLLLALRMGQHGANARGPEWHEMFTRLLPWRRKSA